MEGDTREKISSELKPGPDAAAPPQAIMRTIRIVRAKQRLGNLGGNRMKHPIVLADWRKGIPHLELGAGKSLEVCGKGKKGVATPTEAFT